MRTVVFCSAIVLVSATSVAGFRWQNLDRYPDDLINTPYAWSNVRIEDPQFTSYRIAAEDFTLDRPVRIYGVSFWSIEVGEPWFLGGDWYIYAGGNEPGALIGGDANAPLEHKQIGHNHPEFGPLYDNVMVSRGLTLAAGHYFLGFRTNQAYNPNGEKNNNCGLSTVWTASSQRAFWNFDVAPDGTVRDAWISLSRFNLVTDNEWSFVLVGQYLGDLNCDGNVDFADINAFVLALSDPEEYRRQYPNCDPLLGDINNDGTVDFGDINPFVELLSG